jgi:leucyl-tRNA synthetase
VVNGWPLLRGLETSRSKGDVVPLGVVARVCDLDSVRAAILLAAGVGQDANLTDELADSLLERLRRLGQHGGKRRAALPIRLGIRMELQRTGEIHAVAPLSILALYASR